MTTPIKLSQNIIVFQSQIEKVILRNGKYYLIIRGSAQPIPLSDEDIKKLEGIVYIPPLDDYNNGPGM